MTSNPKSPLFSIIIPIYNVEDFISECLASVFSQKYPNGAPHAYLEVIAIDDCSTDRSANIVAEYLPKHPNLRLIKNATNLGLGLTRNVGLDLAGGTHIIFLDSDDRLAPGSLDRLFKCIELNPSACLLQVNHVKISQDGEKQGVGHQTDLNVRGFENSLEFIQAALLLKPKYAWAKVYSRDLLMRNKFRFSTGFYEDIAWTIAAILAAREISVVAGDFYEYRQRTNSILHTSSKQHLDFFRSYATAFREHHLSLTPKQWMALQETYLSETYYLLRSAATRIPRGELSHFKTEYYLLKNLYNIRSSTLAGRIKRIYIYLYFWRSLLKHG